MKTSELKLLIEEALTKTEPVYRPRSDREMVFHFLKEYPKEKMATAYLCGNYVKALGYNVRVTHQPDKIIVWVSKIKPNTQKGYRRGKDHPKVKEHATQQN